MRSQPEDRVANPQRTFRLKGRIRGVELSQLLAVGMTAVGSHPDSQLMLDHDGVSRHHAVVLVEPDRILLVDQNSKNGTFVNARRVRRAELAVGDTVGFGPAELRLEEVHPEDARLAVELPEPQPPRREAQREPESTVAAAGPRRDRLSRWLRLVSRFVEQLRRSPSRHAAAALAELAHELEAEGCGLFELGGEVPAALSTWGEIEPASLAAIAEAWDATAERSATEVRFVTRPQATACVSFTSQTAFGLIVCGDFASREHCAPLLEALLALCVHFRPRGLDRLASAGASGVPEVVFPPQTIVGVSPAMSALYSQMRPLVQGDLPVLIVGETGVGKELIARSLHLSSPSSAGPFVAINCAAIPAELLEAELFGIGRRVATGVDARRGLFEEAIGGTLFLDEVGEMPEHLQVKLLRVLEEKRLRPVGGQPIELDVRILAATSADLEATGFRRDLFFRLAGFVLRIPPLRQRREDIPILVEGFLRRYASEIGKPVRGITVRALRALREHDWPGNVRQLEHEIRRLVYLCPPQQAIESSYLAAISRGSGCLATTTTQVSAMPGRGAGEAADDRNGEDWASAVSREPSLDLKQLERQVVLEALKRAGGNQVRAAKLIGLSRHGLRRRIERYRLR